jgi:hypothetical protein
MKIKNFLLFFIVFTLVGPLKSFCILQENYDPKDLSSIKEYFYEAIAVIKNNIKKFDEFKEISQQCRDFIKNNHPTEEAEIASMLDVENLLEELISYKKGLGKGLGRNTEKEKYFESFLYAYGEEVDSLIFDTLGIRAADVNQVTESHCVDMPEIDSLQQPQDYLHEFGDKK